MVGQQSDASQSFGSGLTYSSRYFLLKYFNVSTPNDDPDKWRSKQREVEEAEDKAIATEIIKQLDEAIKTFVTKNPEQRDEVAKVVRKYVKNGDYFAITESVVATKLFTEFNKTFLKEEDK